jgi:hypothetical protein
MEERRNGRKWNKTNDEKRGSTEIAFLIALSDSFKNKCCFDCDQFVGFL